MIMPDLVGEMNFVSPEDAIPSTLEVSLPHEYVPERQNLAFMLNYSDGLVQYNVLPVENTELLLVANDVVSVAPHIGIDMIRPSLDMTAASIIVMFRESKEPLGRAYKGEPGYKGAQNLQYTVQTKKNRSIYPRDKFMVAPLADGSNELILGRPSTFEEKKQQIKDYTAYAFALQMEKQLHMKARRVPIELVGGNVIVSNDFVFTLQETFHNNGYAASDIQLMMDHIESPKGNVTLGKDIAVLDAPLRDEKKQRVFHLDMALNVVVGADGREYFLLANPTLAQEILRANGYLDGSAFNLGRWRSMAGHKSYTNAAIEKRARNLTDGAVKAAGKLMRPAIIHQAIETNKRIVGFPGTAHTDIGFSLEQYFHQNNIQPLAGYMDVLRGSLLSVGVSPNQMLDIPSLLLVQGFDEMNMNPSATRISSTRKIPMYAPVNGVQMRGATEEDPSLYFAQGGIRMFDDYTSNTLERIGITHVPIPSAIGLGYGSAGFRCISVAWR